MIRASYTLNIWYVEGNRYQKEVQKLWYCRISTVWCEKDGRKKYRLEKWSEVYLPSCYFPIGHFWNLHVWWALCTWFFTAPVSFLIAVMWYLIAQWYLIIKINFLRNNNNLNHLIYRENALFYRLLKHYKAPLCHSQS